MTTPRRSTVDLHCHTARSDGVVEPLALYAQLRDCGMALVAITDHDTLAGYVELRAHGLDAGSSAAGPRLICGVEINSVGGPMLGRSDQGDGHGGGQELHILGYGIDPGDVALAAALADQRARRRDRIEAMLARLDQMGLPIRGHLPVIAGGIESMGRPHVARALVSTGHATSVEDAFDRFLDVGGPAYVARVGMGPREAIEAIRQATGIASLAHAPSAPDHPRQVRQLMDWGLTAIECFHAGFDEPTSSRMVTFASELGLLATGGSDYHGDGMDYGTARQTSLFVPDSVGEGLLAALEMLR